MKVTSAQKEGCEENGSMARSWRVVEWARECISKGSGLHMPPCQGSKAKVRELLLPARHTTRWHLCAGAKDFLDPLKEQHFSPYRLFFVR
jgi:hypothetical protein